MSQGQSKNKKHKNIKVLFAFYIYIYRYIYSALYLLFANALVSVSGGNLGLKQPLNTCKRVVFAAGIQRRSQSAVGHSK